jgi:hypothetical protein
MTATPGFLILLFFFMVSPIIQGGRLNEKSATFIATFIVAIMVTLPLMVIYFFGVSIFEFISKNLYVLGIIFT